MPRVPTVRQADLERTLRALAAQGLTAARVEITPAGVVIIPGPAGAAAALTAPSAGVTSYLDEWRAERRRRGERASEAQQGGGRADQGA